MEIKDDLELNAYQKLEKEAEKAANELNHKVLFLIKVSCNKCNYCQNALQFEILLKTYRKQRIFFTKFKLKSFKNEFSKEIDMINTRLKLHKIWPCEDCIKQYNPTNRSNHNKYNPPENFISFTKLIQERT